MIDITAEILPGKSIGGLSLGTPLQDVEAALFEIDQYFTEGSFVSYESYACTTITVADFGICFTAGESGLISRITCWPPYEGKFKTHFFPGMTVLEILEKARQHRISYNLLTGNIVFDDEPNACFDIPDEFEGNYYDDIDHEWQLPYKLRPTISVSH